MPTLENVPDSNPKRKAWADKHSQVCPINYSGSAPGMEAAGACRMWQHSEEKNRLRYTTFLGDGDSKSFSAVSQEVSYPVAKIDCVGHVQKRLGTRLRNLVKKKILLMGHVWVAKASSQKLELTACKTTLARQ